MKHRETFKVTLQSQTEIADLVRRLSEAEEALAAALRDQVDAIVDPSSAMPILLRQAQEALTVSEARYHRLMSRLAAIIFELQPDGTIIFANDAVKAITGYTPNQLQDKNWWSVFFPGDRAAEAQALQQQLQTGDVTGYEMTLTAKDGSPVILELNSANYYSSDRALQQILGFGVDVTQRKHAEREVENYRQHLEQLVAQRTTELEHANDKLQQERETLRTLIDSITDEVWFVDAQGNLALINVKAAHEFGSKSAELLSRPFLNHVSTLEVYRLDGSRLLADEVPLMRSLRGELLVEQDEILRHPQTGEMRYRQVNSAPLRSKSGEIIGAVAVARDVTAQYHAEQERADLLRREQAAREKAEEADAFKLQFIAMISHELRAPLSSIKGFSSTLLAPDVHWKESQVQEFVRIIDSEADRLAELVSNLMDISRMQAGILRVTLEPIEFRAAIDEARSRMMAVTGKHDLVLDIADDLPLVQGDAQRLAQVLVNLVHNAAKYSPSGTRIVLSARQIADNLQIDVADEGQGISPEARANLFQPFRQADQSLSKSQKGAGLGLAICKGLVEAHGGRIWIQDRPGPGTTVSFTIPISQTKSDA